MSDGMVLMADKFLKKRNNVLTLVIITKNKNVMVFLGGGGSYIMLYSRVYDPNKGNGLWTRAIFA